jgi:hypothetical protein
VTSVRDYRRHLVVSYDAAMMDDERADLLEAVEAHLNLPAGAEIRPVEGERRSAIATTGWWLFGFIALMMSPAAIWLVHDAIHRLLRLLGTWGW